MAGDSGSTNTPAQNGRDEVRARAEREREFHDQRFADDTEARKADRFYAVTGSSGDAYSAAVEEIPTGSTVLEVGVGESMLALVLAARGCEVVGIDISPVAIEAARARAADLPGATFEVMNAEELSFDDESFDAVIGSGIVHHLDMATSMAEFARVLRPGGRALFLEPLGYNPAIELYRRVTPSQRTDDEHPLRRVDVDLMKERFGHVEISYFHLTSLAALAFRSRPSFEAVLGRLEATDRWLFSRVPALGLLAWFCLVELEHPRPSAVGRAGGPNASASS